MVHILLKPGLENFEHYFAGMWDECNCVVVEYSFVLVIANTFFQQHKKRLYTWTSPDGQYRNQIDYILCNQRWRSSIQSAKIRPGDDCGSDHEVLIAKSKLKLKKASGGDGIPAKLFQILKDDAVKVLPSICQQIWKTQQWWQEWKGQFSFQSQRKAMPKKCTNSRTITLISHASKVMLKIPQARFQQYLNRELPDVQARKGRGTRD